MSNRIPALLILAVALGGLSACQSIPPADDARSPAARIEEAARSEPSLEQAVAQRQQANPDPAQLAEQEIERLNRWLNRLQNQNRELQQKIAQSRQDLRQAQIAAADKPAATELERQKARAYRSANQARRLLEQAQREQSISQALLDTAAPAEALPWRERLSKLAQEIQQLQNHSNALQALSSGRIPN